eukprot:3620376-Lingulodinium_polyedra.AAC.1
MAACAERRATARRCGGWRSGGATTRQQTRPPLQDVLLPPTHSRRVALLRSLASSWATRCA